MKKILSIYANWRLDAIYLIACLALVLLCSDADTLGKMIAIKIVAFLLIALDYYLCRTWNKKLTEIFDEYERRENS